MTDNNFRGLWWSMVRCESISLPWNVSFLKNQHDFYSDHHYCVMEIPSSVTCFKKQDGGFVIFDVNYCTAKAGLVVAQSIFSDFSSKVPATHINPMF